MTRRPSSVTLSNTYGGSWVGHPRLVLAKPRPGTFLEQFYDLTWHKGGQKRTRLLSWLRAIIVACPRPQCSPEAQSGAWLETSPVLARLWDVAAGASKVRFPPIAVVRLRRRRWILTKRPLRP